uniref:Uncharacterized protein n=1 Tax=Oryza sativa subsp. japonica TaxID=39947 RepID=Q69XD2_ORYSJ|nr:hypothetical protein [Oryza sativa Japonica Group]
MRQQIGRRGRRRGEAHDGGIPDVPPQHGRRGGATAWEEPLAASTIVSAFWIHRRVPNLLRRVPSLLRCRRREERGEERPPAGRREKPPAGRGERRGHRRGERRSRRRGEGKCSVVEERRGQPVELEEGEGRGD